VLGAVVAQVTAVAGAEQDALSGEESRLMVGGRFIGIHVESSDETTATRYAVTLGIELQLDRAVRLSQLGAMAADVEGACIWRATPAARAACHRLREAPGVALPAERLLLPTSVLGGGRWGQDLFAAGVIRVGMGEAVASAFTSN
jgi:hypothetical protein